MEGGGDNLPGSALEFGALSRNASLPAYAGCGGLKTLTRDRRTLVGEFLRRLWLRRCAGFLLGIMHAGYCARMPAKRCSKVCAESHAGTPDGRKCGLGAPQGLPKTAKLSLRDAKCGQDASKSVYF